MKTIKVTQEHIDRSKAILESFRTSRACNCPVALALQDAGCDNAAVFPTSDGTVCSFGATIGNRKIVALPKEVGLFVMFFDVNLRVEPFEFQLPID